MIVRPIIAADVPAVQAMTRRFLSDDGPYKGRQLPCDDARVAALVDQMMQGNGLSLIAERDGQPCGMFAMFCFDHPIMGTKIAAELCWWMEPEQRGSHAAIRMLRAAERWASEQGATMIEMIAPDERIGEFYQHVGYRKTDTHYMRDL